MGYLRLTYETGPVEMEENNLHMLRKWYLIRETKEVVLHFPVGAMKLDPETSARFLTLKTNYPDLANIEMYVDGSKVVQNYKP